MTQIFAEIAQEAQVGDYFRLPFHPVVQVLERTEQPGQVSYTVATPQGDREEWVTPTIDVLDKPFDQLTPEEWKRLENYSDSESELAIAPTSHEVTATKRLDLYAIWEGAAYRGSISRSYLTRLWEANGTAHLTKEEAVQALLGYCPEGLFPAFEFEQYDSLPNRGSGRCNLYKIYHQDRVLGVAMETSTGFAIGDKLEKYPSLEAAAIALRDWVAA